MEESDAAHATYRWGADLRPARCEVCGVPVRPADWLMNDGVLRLCRDSATAVRGALPRLGRAPTDADLHALAARWHAVCL